VLSIATLVGGWASAAVAAAPNPFKPDDSFVVTRSGAPLMRGNDTLATLPRGQTLKVLKVEGSWVGTAVTVNGRKIGGWVWAGQAATPGQYAAMQRSARRRYSFAPTPSFGASGGYSTAPSYFGPSGVLPNQSSPNRLRIGETPYGPSYWRADKKIIGY
jgi:hypothetical protein